MSQGVRGWVWMSGLLLKESSLVLVVLQVKCQRGIHKHLQMNGLLTKQAFINTHFWENSASLNEMSDPTLLDLIL